MKKDSAEINRVVNSTLRNLSAGCFVAGLGVERFTAAPEADHLTIALEVNRSRLHLKTGEALSRRSAQAIGPAVRIS